MWWILSALLSLIAWAVWYIWEIPQWIPIVVTAVLFTLTIVLFIYRRIAAKRAGAALEQAIFQQGAQQALNARPERRAEIQELQQQVQQGISALKQSKLGRGKRGGGAALYSLPWYVIIGPPGAGKTTAIKHSGLVFPFSGAGGGAVRGVGGTRNCDWWFTNEAILLDTAGRYTTEADDRDEWIAFLQMLLRYRSRQPINGILVAISITDLLDANEAQLEAMGKKLRARVDEVMTQLRMVVPVYLLFTKCDLIAGFSEFFGDLRKSEREQGWGATLRLDMPKTEPARIFDQEFDVLSRQIHARSLKRLVGERNREVREKIFQFPLEFAAVKRNLAELVGTIFMVNAFQGTPIFRGFYFTSGTQEGLPMDRVLARMGQAMGIPPVQNAAQQAVESKSYFLHDVFMKVVFPDGDVAARSQSEMRRQQFMRIAISAAALSLATVISIPSIISFLNNRELVATAKAEAEAAAQVNWAQGPVSAKLKGIAPVRERLAMLDGYHEEGTPLSMGWMMYQGDEIARPLVAVYVKSLQDGMVVPVRAKLEAKLKTATGDQYLVDREILKTYLMLADVEHLDIDWETRQLTRIWTEILRSSSDVNELELRRELAKHVRYYLELVKSGKVKAIPSDQNLVDKVRKTLQAVPVNKRYYDLFVNTLIDDTYTPEGDIAEEKKYPAFTLQDLFPDREEVMKVLSSQLFDKEKRWKEVEGPYTEKGHYAVLVNIKEGAALLEREAWVVPLTPDERPDKVPVNLKRVAEDYETRYIISWTEWTSDIVVRPPADVAQAINLYKTLTTTEWPMLRILRALEDHTQWKRDPSSFDANSKSSKAAERALEKRLNQASGLRIDVDMQKIGERQALVPGVFRKTVEFGIPQDTKAGKSTAPITDTPLAKYINILEKLRGDMLELRAKNPNVDARVLALNLQDAAKQTDALIQPLDDKAKAMLTPLLLVPLKVGGMRLTAGGKWF